MAKSSIHFATGPTTLDNLRACVARAVLEGVDLRRHGKLSRSRIIDTAIRYGAEASVAALQQPAPVALPEQATLTDAERLKAARERAGLSLRALAALLGYKDKASIQNVERGMRMPAAMRAWVESQESGQ
jgi:hypothetical protein